MDHIKDFANFQRLVRRLCETFNKPATDELIESWWKALRHIDYDMIEYRIDQYIGKADDTTKFPRPAQMRPKEANPPDPNASQENPVRGYWRSVIVNEVMKLLGYRCKDAFEPVLIANASTLGRAMLALLDDLAQQEVRDGRTGGMHIFCYRECGNIAKTIPVLAS